MSKHTKRNSHLLQEPEKPKNIFVTIRRLIGYLEKYRWKLILAIILLIISTCITVVATRMIGVCIDKYIVTRDWAGLKSAGLQLILLYVAASFLSWMQEYLMIQTAQNTAQKIRDDLFGKMQMLPLRYFDTRPHGETMSRMTNDVDTIATMLNTNLSQVLQSVLTMVTTFAMMLYLSPILTLCVLGTIPILLWTTKKNTKMVRKFFAQRQEHLGKLNGFIEESISGQKAVKVFAKEEEQMV
ncbi:MAG: ABC transporter ATP-binding protein, partial [Epulopiscium sp.]|nr:ABC transporter ATP-binding protein [Candidatus Epulonipiscium sp.]